MIAVADLGALAVRLFGARDRYLKRVLTAGAERITGLQLAASAARVNGRMHFQYKPVPWYVLEYFLPVEYPKQLRRWLTYGGNDEGAAGLDFLRFAKIKQKTHTHTHPTLELFIVPPTCSK